MLNSQFQQATLVFGSISALRVGSISVTKGKQSDPERRGKGLSLRAARQEGSRLERQSQTEEDQIKESQGQPA